MFAVNLVFMPAAPTPTSSGTLLPTAAIRDLDSAQTPQHLRALVSEQEGVLSRVQLEEAGVRPDVGREQVRQRRWQRILPGVYLTNTGRPSFRHRCWAAVLHGGQAAILTGTAAAHLDGVVDRPPGRIEIAVPHGYRIRSSGDWLVVRQVRAPLDPPIGRPARTSRWFTALLRTQSATNEDEVIAILTETARASGTVVPLRAEARRWKRLRWRSVITAVTAPDEAGHESVLEWKFTHLVIRAHGLPEPTRQAWERMGDRQIRVDGVAEEWGLGFELDGRIHEGRTEDDIWRDNHVLVTNERPTLRFRWPHILGRPCMSAVLVEQGYRMRGWPGRGRPCSTDCPVGR